MDAVNSVMSIIHSSVWSLLVVVFFIAYILLSKGNQKGYFISHQIARLFYVLMIVSGGYTLFYLTTLGDLPINYTIKGILALWLIYLMEKILGSKKRGEFEGRMSTYYWVQFTITLLLVIFLGFGVIFS
ncbi:DUF1516 family protein [Salsuginibacillus kocurii]|uniref:DUF1516 family protein n=1 Tax=Salsuginibacillus kocurii TaxID=427078 RepID=UPI000375FFCE|nr:DUF1516 family protein [Salsuginibacillus kocurii]